MKKISILGSGWLGLPLSKKLSEKYLINLSTSSKEKLEKISDKNIKSYLLDISNITDNIDEFLASEILIINIPSKDFSAFKNLVSKIEKSKIKKVIFISSTSVYKDCNKTIKEENEEFLNDNVLLKIEDLFQNMHNIQSTILRFGGLIGYDRNLVKHFQNKEVKNSKTYVNMIHRHDCINIICEILSKNIFDELFNCCASSHPTKEEFYKYCADVSDYNIPVFDEKLLHYKIIDNQKLKDKLAYKFIYDDLLKIKFD